LPERGKRRTLTRMHARTGNGSSGVEDEAEDPHRGSSMTEQHQAPPACGRLPRQRVRKDAAAGTRQDNRRRAGSSLTRGPETRTETLVESLILAQDQRWRRA